jgi:hypothetical protein
MVSKHLPSFPPEVATQPITKLLTHLLIHLYQLWNLVAFSASLPVPPLVLLSLN